MSDKPKRERKAPTAEQLAKRRVKLEYQIRQALNKIYKLHLTKDNLVALVDLIQSDPDKSYSFLSEPNYEKVKKAYEAKKSCIISMSKDEIDVLEEIVKKGRFDGKGFKDVMRSGLKGVNSLAKAGGYKHGISDAILSETVGRMVPGSERYTDAISGYADKRIRGMGLMGNLKRGIKTAGRIAQTANDISEDMGYSLSDMAMDKANEYIPEQYQGAANVVGKYAKKRIRGMGANPYMPKNIRGGSLGPVPDFNSSAEYNDPVYIGTGDNDQYFASRQSGRGMRNSYY
jgi:hypothetical protein